MQILLISLPAFFDVTAPYGDGFSINDAQSDKMILYPMMMKITQVFLFTLLFK
jgi:hypothetical protein